MKRFCVWSVFCLLSVPMVLGAESEVGAAAPGFELKDVEGKVHSLSAFKGKYVVLEWTNPDCPFVKKHYSTGNMQSLQKEWTEKGVVWLSICSSASGRQGHYTPSVWREKLKAQKSSASALLLDASGKVGRAYGAKTTPHMFIIDPEGTLIYRGAIDDNSSWDPATVKGARNYVSDALEAATSGKAISPAETRPYGCSVKY